MDEYATKIEDLPDLSDQIIERPFQEDRNILTDENINLQIKKEEPGFFSSIMSTYFNNDIILLVLLLVIRTFPINNLIGYIPIVNSIVPDSGIFATIATSIVLAVIYITLIQFK